MLRSLLTIAPMLICSSGIHADDKSAKAERFKHQVTGLFDKSREADLRSMFEELPDIRLIGIDFDNAEITVEYIAAKAFPNAKPTDIVKRFDDKLRSASHSTFGIKPLRTIPLDKLEKVEIAVTGHDCKACCLAAYESIFKLDGVERATASFREGRVTALIDPQKTNRAKLIDALKKKGVRLKTPLFVF